MGQVESGRGAESGLAMGVKERLHQGRAPHVISGRFRDMNYPYCQAHKRSVLEMAEKTWNSQPVEEWNIPDIVQYKRYLLRQ